MSWWCRKVSSKILYVNSLKKTLSKYMFNDISQSSIHTITIHQSQKTINIHQFANFSSKSSESSAHRIAVFFTPRLEQLFINLSNECLGEREWENMGGATDFRDHGNGKYTYMLHVAYVL